MVKFKNNEERKEKISASLRTYFMTEQGNVHKDKLSRLQAKRMVLYNKYIKDNTTKLENNESE